MIESDLNIELVKKLNALKLNLEDQGVSERTLEIYLLNNVNMFLDSLCNAKTARDIDNAASIFSRFCTESMDWNTPLYQQCSSVAEIGFKLAKVWQVSGEPL